MVKGSDVLAAAAVCTTAVLAFVPGPTIHKHGSDRVMQVNKRQYPTESVGVQTIISPGGTNITFKQPGQAGVCETTLGVNSYSGFINLGPDTHSFVCMCCRISVNHD